ncbi:four helix bundle protein [Flaviaesturariibacter amylovorans]|uniref:four helix bundle protein n=1 Tax=Flaviaesturariibacter amylovorans TaxID=1084520 RepID=UPI0031E5917A
MAGKKPYRIDERLIEFAAAVIKVTEALPSSPAGRYVSGQLVRSGLAPVLQYGEAQAAESPDDFIHKMKVALKELRETFNALRVIRRMNWIDLGEIEDNINENNELISIFIKSIETARNNNNKK